MAIFWVCWLVLRLNSRCAANLVKGRHTSTLVRHTSCVGRSRRFWIKARQPCRRWSLIAGVRGFPRPRHGRCSRIERARWCLCLRSRPHGKNAEMRAELPLARRPVWAALVRVRRWRIEAGPRLHSGKKPSETGSFDSISPPPPVIPHCLGCDLQSQKCVANPRRGVRRATTARSSKTRTRNTQEHEQPSDKPNNRPPHQNQGRVTSVNPPHGPGTAPAV